MLATHQILKFRNDGFLFMGQVFSAAEVQLIVKESQPLFQLDCEKRILEKNGVMRSFFAPHEESRTLDIIGRLDRIVTPVRQLLESEVYIHQVKLNTKQSLLGDWWEWHQDFPYWHIEDAMPVPRVLTAMIFLDDVNEFNGPMLLIPGSQKAGMVDTSANNDVLENENVWFKNYQLSKEYMSDLTSNLKFTLKQNTLTKWMKENGIYSAKGPAGSLLLFDGLVFHASSNNLSAWNRNTYLITYNSVENKLGECKSPRPHFLANRNYQPVNTLLDSSLLAANIDLDFEQLSSKV